MSDKVSAFVLDLLEVCDKHELLLNGCALVDADVWISCLRSQEKLGSIVFAGGTVKVDIGRDKPTVTYELQPARWVEKS